MSVILNQGPSGGHGGGFTSPNHFGGGSLLIFTAKSQSTRPTNRLAEAPLAQQRRPAVAPQRHRQHLALGIARLGLRRKGFGEMPLAESEI